MLNFGSMALANKALVLEANGDLRFHADRKIQPAQAQNSLRVRVAACGVCGSDIPRAYDKGAYHYPLVLGHEFSAIVDEDAHGFKVGDKVAVFPLIPLSRDAAWQTGDYAQCKEYNYFGSRCDGGMQTYLHVPAENLFRVPDGVNILHASMTEPAAVALHGVRKMRIRAGDTGFVLGAGPIGNMTAQWLRIHGCRKVIISDVDEKKLAIAREMGFETINSRQHDAVAMVKELTNGEGAERVVEACGLPQTFLQAVQATARFGEVVFMGNIHGEFKIGEKDFSNILRRELTIYGTWNSKVIPRPTDDWTTVLNYLDRELIVAPLISDTPSLEEGPDIMASIHGRKRFHNKVIFRIHE